MIIHTRRFILTDFSECDREAFVEYQMDPRYRRLYGLDNQCEQKAHDLFELFLSWQSDQPRQRFQLGMFEQISGRLCGSAGLRRKLGEDESTLALGLELRPEDWGRYRAAIEVTEALLDYGFHILGAKTIVGTTSSGNTRVAKLALWFGARIVAQRNGGANWMTERGWHEIDWALSREHWSRPVT